MSLGGRHALHHMSASTCMPGLTPLPPSHVPGLWAVSMVSCAPWFTQLVLKVSGDHDERLSAQQQGMYTERHNRIGMTIIKGDREGDTCSMDLDSGDKAAADGVGLLVPRFAPRKIAL